MAIYQMKRVCVGLALSSALLISSSSTSRPQAQLLTAICSVPPETIENCKTSGGTFDTARCKCQKAGEGLGAHTDRIKSLNVKLVDVKAGNIEDMKAIMNKVGDVVIWSLTSKNAEKDVDIAGDNTKKSGGVYLLDTRVRGEGSTTTDSHGRTIDVGRVSVSHREGNIKVEVGINARSEHGARTESRSEVGASASIEIELGD